MYLFYINIGHEESIVLAAQDWNPNMGSEVNLTCNVTTLTDNGSLQTDHF